MGAIGLSGGQPPFVARPRSGPHGERVALRFLLLVPLLASCVGVVELPGEERRPPPPDDPTTPLRVPSSTTRRLTSRELGRTIKALTGVRPEALGRLPPESRGYAHDRVVNGQTVSPAHLEAYLAIAEEVADTLLAEARLDEITPACPDPILPPAAPPRTDAISGVGLTGNPDWAFGPNEETPTRLSSVYAPDPTVFYTHDFAAPGRYAVAFELETDARLGSAEIALDDAVVHIANDVAPGATRLETTLAIAEAGPHLIELRIVTGNDNLRVHYDRLTIVGPEDPTAGRFDAERRACGRAFVAELAPRALRRPLAADEEARLSALFDEGAAEGLASGLRMLLAGILATPSFLYLVELGTPVEGAPGAFALGPHELAARLSYALCELPPDAELRAAAASGAILAPAELEAHARRLLALDCGRDTVRRFLEEWLWLDRLASLNKSPEAFPEFDEDVRAGMQAEAARFLDEMLWSEGAALPAMFAADFAWPDARTAHLWGIAGADGARTALPPERAGVLTLPGVLAVTGTFDGTSPVHRGVFVLEEILCDDLPPPPADLEIVPPPPDPDSTTRERWAAHSSVAQCRGCHERIDPPGFAFEDFDGLGRHRTVENGRPIDARGGLPAIGLADGAIEGGAALARAVATSEPLGACFADHWLRFALGRLPGEADGPDLASVAGVAREDSIAEALVTLVRSETFRRRYEEAP